MPDANEMLTDIRLLQQGQKVISAEVHGVSRKLDGVVDALTTLIRLTEKHDALTDRVKDIEARNESADGVISRGNSFMFAAAVGVPVLLAAVAWIFDASMSHEHQIAAIYERIAKIEAKHESEK